MSRGAWLNRRLFSEYRTQQPASADLGTLSLGTRGTEGSQAAVVTTGTAIREAKNAEAQLRAIVREADADVPIADLFRNHGISGRAFSLWRNQARPGRHRGAATNLGVRPRVHATQEHACR
jgi:hypothetical protein